MSIIIILILIIFLIIIIFKRETKIEKFKFNKYDCPVILVNILNRFLAYYPNNGKVLYNSNPIVFNSLDEYKKYMEYQNSKGINCPYLNVNDGEKIIPIEKIFSLKSGEISKKILKTII
jgi:hypothetical protein